MIGRCRQMHVKTQPVRARWIERPCSEPPSVKVSHRSLPEDWRRACAGCENYHQNYHQLRRSRSVPSTKDTNQIAHCMVLHGTSAYGWQPNIQTLHFLAVSVRCGATVQRLFAAHRLQRVPKILATSAQGRAGSRGVSKCVIYAGEADEKPGSPSSLRRKDFRHVIDVRVTSETYDAGSDGRLSLTWDITQPIMTCLKSWKRGAERCLLRRCAYVVCFSPLLKEHVIIPVVRDKSVAAVSKIGNL